MAINTTITAQNSGKFNFTTTPSAPSDYNWLPAGALTNSFLNVDNTGLNISMELTGLTGTLTPFPGTYQASPSITTSTTEGTEGVLTLATSGFGAQGITITIRFSQPITSADFKLFHINGSSYSGDLCTVSAETMLGNTIDPVFTASSNPSYAINSPVTGQINATGSSTARDRDEVGVAFSDNSGINSITIVWSNCTTCGANFHGLGLINQLNFTMMSALPVELTHFGAKLNEYNQGLLNWKTASETNNKGFEVEHAQPNSAEMAFETIGFVNGAGTTTRIQNYAYQTEQLSVGTHYFRIKQIDIDGTSTYSEIEAVTVEAKDQMMTLYPNPTAGKTMIELGELIEGDVLVKVINYTGQTVFSRTYKDQLLIDLALDFLPAGHYLISVDTEKGRKLLSLLKQ